MGRFLAIDYGEKRVGLAVSDYMQMIATKLTTVSTLDIFPYLKDYMSREEVDLIVVGNPKQMDNTPSESAKYVQTFVDNLSNSFPDMDIYMIDERYTSKMASQTIAQSGMKKKKRQEKGLIDTVAAVLILQDFMKMYQNGVTVEHV
ncbi:MAG: Holliday junction resolvase RuvX [Bacteroidales bacterium]|nr:Holliday junction resolvase RuvX [Bacteroidales bacterium]